MMRSCLLSVLLPLAGGLCLPDGVPPEQRKLLVNGNGDTYPLGIWAANYAASWAMNKMMVILAEEVFGLNTTWGIGAGTIDGYFGVMPCKQPTNISDRGCDDDAVTQYHINMEAWVMGYPSVFRDIQNRYPKTAPVSLGNMGYNGWSTEYMPQAPIDDAWASEGLAVQYYANWNASWHNPSKYFNNIEEVNASEELMPCSLSLMSDAAVAEHYLEVTGDMDGANVVNGKAVSLKCHAGHWWLAPACRSNTSICVPFHTAGTGWGLHTMIQRCALLNLPIGLGVAKSWTAYTQFPFVHPRALLYWWTPDPTFLDLNPQPFVYPPHNRKEYQNGIFLTAAEQISVDTLVSSDLMTLAPNVQRFLEQLFISLDQMNAILIRQKDSGESWENVTCEWLRSNEAQWRAWIPDESKCFAGFGLFDQDLNDFVDTSVNATGKITCQACAPGTYSQPLGETFICVPCANGTSQPSGAALSCKQCKPGEYQDDVGANSCKRCSTGEYQDELGSVSCKRCPETTVTLGPGSVGLADCGCPTSEINMDEGGGFRCAKCSEGMTCPDLSQLVDLKDGESELGPDFTPKIDEGYYSTQLQPTEVFRCGSVTACPGGTPDSCAGGLIGTPCSKCPEGQTWTGRSCESCTGWRQVLWVIAALGIFAFLVLAYYLTTSKVTAKATVLFATTASFGMLVMAMQNLGLIGMMTVEWPTNLVGIFSICQFLLLDIDSYGFSCIAGQSDPIRYILSALIFPAGVVWLGLCWAISQLLRSSRRWDGSKVVSCMGAFLQVGFSTMSATSLSPMMCYKHPNGQRSVLKYPGVICGSSDHHSMLVAGALLLSIFVLGFVALCSYAARMVPRWSSRRQDKYVAAARFLVFRFRLDSWWFGVPLLVRGPLLSLPVVLATDYPPVQVMSITAVMAGFLVMQMLAWPWKVPMLNLSDCIITFCVTILVTTSSLFLPPVEGAMKAFAHFISTATLSGIALAMGLMCLMTLSALFYRGALGGKKELRVFNLGRITSSAELAGKIKELAAELEKVDRGDLTTKINQLAVFDLNKITTCITLLATEVAPPAERAVTFKFNSRIGSHSFDPNVKRPKPIVSKRSLRASGADMENQPEEGKVHEPEGNEPGHSSSPKRLSEVQSEWI